MSQPSWASSWDNPAVFGIYVGRENYDERLKYLDEANEYIKLSIEWSVPRVGEWKAFIDKLKAYPEALKDWLDEVNARE